MNAIRLFRSAVDADNPAFVFHTLEDGTALAVTCMVRVRLIEGIETFVAPRAEPNDWSSVLIAEQTASGPGADSRLLESDMPIC